MISRFFLYIKHNLPFLWQIIENVNGFLFQLIFGKRLKKNAFKILAGYENNNYTYRFLTESDLNTLLKFFLNQDKEQFRFFNPHSFDKQTLNRLFKNPSFLMFGVFDENLLIGYFFLRCFLNRKCFTGRLVDEKYQGQGIAKRMGKILHNIAWDSNFRVFGTASQNNVKSINSYKAINDFKIIKELDNNYIYFEYLKSEEKPF
jgi:RimJ/RimL family protein N-acetyltransferase